MARVLITRISSFGDVAMLVPVISSVAARYPQDRFVVLTRKAFTPLFENLGFNVNVRSFDVTRHGSFWGLLMLTKSCLGSNYSHVADVHDVLRTKILRKILWLFGKKVAHIDKGRSEKKKVIRDKVLQPPLKPTIERYMEVMEKIGFPAEMSFNNFFEFTKRSLYPLRSVVTEKNGKWIGIAPFSKHEGKIYPIDKMERVLATLIENENNHVFLFGAGDYERGIIEDWEKKYDNTIAITSNKLNLENEMLLISYLDVMISMDSANMHLASLVQVPVVSIWGATHPSLGFYGYKQDINNAVQIDLECRPCAVFGNIPCARGDYACLNMVDESMVVSKVNEVLDAKQIPFE